MAGVRQRGEDSEEEENPQSLKIKNPDLTSYEPTLNKP